MREHRFEDGTSLRLPSSRAGQLHAVDELGPGLGQAWVDHVAAYAEEWEVLRRHYLEVPWDPAALPRDLAAILDRRESLRRRLARTLRDPRLRLVAAYPFLADGHDPRDVPSWAGVHSYVEQRFGAWAFAGGADALADALAARLATRRVDVRTGVSATDIVLRGGRAVAVATSAGEVDADLVVCAIDPRQLPALASYVARTMPAIPPVVCHVGVDLDASAAAGLPEEPHDLVVHGDPMLVVRAGGTAPDGARAVTIHGRGRLAEDILLALARQGIDLRPGLITRVDRSPRDLVAHWGGSPLGSAVAGAAHRAPPSSAGTPRSPACSPPGRTRRPAAGSRTSGCRPLSLPRSSGRPEATRGPAGTRPRPRSDADVEPVEDLQRRGAAVQRVEVQARRTAGQQLLAELGCDGAMPSAAHRGQPCPRRAPPAA